HRIDAEDRVLAHRLVALDVHAAADAGMDEVTLAIDMGQHAGQITAVDITALHHFVQPCQSRRRHAYRFGSHPCSPPKASRQSRAYGPMRLKATGSRSGANVFATSFGPDENRHGRIDVPFGDREGPAGAGPARPVPG